MNQIVTVIPISNVAMSFLPLAVIAWFMWRWSMPTRVIGFASARMLVQLVLIGYVLTALFSTEHFLVVSGVLIVMLAASSWIALRPLGGFTRQRYFIALGAISLGSLSTLALVLLAVLETDPWFNPRIAIPIAGMIFSSAMNTVSLAADRLDAEIRQGTSFGAARPVAFNAAMIPMLNSFFAVGLVTLPGMMTGQILSGVEPHIAVRYQIVVMCMTFGASGLSAIAYFALCTKPTPRAAPNR